MGDEYWLYQVQLVSVLNLFPVSSFLELCFVLLFLLQPRQILNRSCNLLNHRTQYLSHIYAYFPKNSIHKMNFTFTADTLSRTRSIHFGRLYTNGSGNSKGKEADLCEALRCLGQALHCLEDFGAHTNYCELTLRELGYHDVFPHCGVAAELTVKGKRMFPLVTGT